MAYLDHAGNYKVAYEGLRKLALDPKNNAALVGKDLDEYSLDTVKMFHSDAVSAGFQLETKSPTPALRG